MTRAKVLQLGLFILLLGGVGYVSFRSLGFDDASAGIAAEALLVLIVFAWTGSYFFRVVTGKMTFIEQRKRYRKVYDQLTNSKLQEKFDELSKEDQIRLIKEIDEEKNVF